MSNKPNILKLTPDEILVIRDWMLKSRHELKMTQKTLSEKTGMSIALISHMENDISNMSVVTALTLLNVFPSPPSVYDGLKSRLAKYTLDSLNK